MEIEAQLESLDNKIEKYNKKTDKLSRLVSSLVTSIEQKQETNSKEEMKELFSEIQKDYSKNQKGLNKKILELKTAISKANDTIENFSQNSVENIDINKLYGLFDEFKTTTDLSNKTVNSSIEKIEKMLSDYNQNLEQINLSSGGQENVKESIKSLNDEFYLELIQLFDSLSFEDETEELKEFMEDILSSVTVKTDENTEKLNNIMLQFKKLLNKIEGIEKTQNSISDYLKPEDESELVYSFDDIQSDLAKMRLVLNDISNSQDIVGEISDKIQQTSSQIENISKLLGTTSDTEEGSFAINKKIEELNSQVYDISLRTNKLILSNEDSNIELKNNLELFKEVFEKANPEKIYELFYELTHYFNDVTEKINEVTLTAKASHTETVTIKNALIHVGEWLDTATGVLEEMRAGISSLLGGKTPAIQPIQSNDYVLDAIEELREGLVAYTNKLAIPPSQGDEDTRQFLEESLSNVYKRVNIMEERINARIDKIDGGIAELIAATSSKEPPSRTTSSHLKNIDKKLEELENVLAQLSEKVLKE